MSIDADSPDDNSLGSNDCDMSCGACCVHHVVNSHHGVSSVSKAQMLMPDTALFVSNFIYRLKRPPKA